MKALETIEKIISLADPDEKDKTLRMIYRIAHSANKAHSCWRAHENWRQEEKILREQLKEI